MRSFIIDGVRMTEREMRQMAAKEDASFGRDIMQPCRSAINVLCLNGHDVLIDLGASDGKPLPLSSGM